MDKAIREKIRQFRLKGKTYSEIQESLGAKISKSTLSYICKDIVLSAKQNNRISLKIQESLQVARKKSALAALVKRQERAKRLLQKNRNLGKIIQQVEVSKIALAMLFLGEGSKTHTATVTFGNSNPDIIRLFLKFFRKCYQTQSEKFHCTVQCRVNQNHESLKLFWSKVTGISLKQFYKTQVDPRTAGKPLKKLDYKGVCRIDYLSTEVVCDIHQSIKVIQNAGL